MRSSSSSSSFIFKKRPSFHAQLGLDVPPKMKPLHISLNTAHSGCKPSAFISSFIHSYKVFFLYPHISPLPPPHFYMLIPNHPNSYVPHAKTTSIYPALPPHQCSRLYKSTLRFLSFSDTLHIHLTIIHSVLSRLFRFAFFIAQVSVPDVSALWTHLSLYAV